MTTKENPAPRANAGSRANSKSKPEHIKSLATDWEADTAGWLALRLSVPSGLARLLAVLASLGRAFG